MGVIQLVPALADASQEQSQIIFDKLLGAFAVRQLARIHAKTDRCPA
jgi:hypothetical protein